MRINFISPTANVGGGIRVIAIYARALMQMGMTVASYRRRPSRARLADTEIVVQRERLARRSGGAAVVPGCN